MSREPIANGRTSASSHSSESFVLQVSGMHCAGCEALIERSLRSLPGVRDVIASVQDAQVEVILGSDTGRIIDNTDSTSQPITSYAVTQEEVERIIADLGYVVVLRQAGLQDLPRNTCGEDPGNAEGERDRCVEDPAPSKRRISQIVALVIILIALYIIADRFGLLALLGQFPSVGQDVALGMVFVAGLVTSLHCVAMCGGINIAQSINGSKSRDASIVRTNLLYTTGRVISYTVIGGIVGGVGSTFSLGGGFRGAVALIAGFFMIILGANMLGFLPDLRSFVPRLPDGFRRRVAGLAQGGSPLTVGLLNGLMPCGPLQAMQLYALSTGSIVTGALSMFLFGLGTVPLMFAFGTLSSKLNRSFAKKMLTVSALLIVVFGVSMFGNGLALSGVSAGGIIEQVSRIGQGDSQVVTATMDGDVQTVLTSVESGSFEAISVTKGVPVHWTIVAGEGVLNGCNNAIIIPDYGIEKSLVEGENTIEFTPTQTGVVSYSCWMGMI
ncbi:MAG: hypothetical protein HGA54_08645, partial [Actinobacteria bacterium]|nr:hypothetical protein [Actinomycetota bacterium]